ncbi:hypothetical protein HGA88_04160 [Candidatus Roizmanbacteria bacterium]|nr:hypothetical protein [Candidatus Roizmanbacteria bacterium]
MRSNTLIGIAFIFLGFLFILANFRVLHLSWDMLVLYWPALIIFLGILVLVGLIRSQILIVLLILIASIAFLSEIQKKIYRKPAPAATATPTVPQITNTEAPNKIATQNFLFPYTGTKIAQLSLEAGGGNYTMNTSTQNLLEATMQSTNASYSVNRTSQNEVDAIQITGNSSQTPGTQEKNTATIHLNETPEWTMNFKLGASTVHFDLSPYNIKNITIDAGASNFKIKTGVKSTDMTLSIRAGTSNFNLSIPQTVGAEIKTQTSLTDKTFQGFTQVGDNQWQTANFGTAPQKLHIDLASGFSSITVTRY